VAGRSPPKRDADLGEYQAKRDFRRTPEPALEARPRPPRPPEPAVPSEPVPSESPVPSDPRPGRDARAARFVVHEHHARRLHWDLRLERDGVLMSWAIPNGIPDDPSENRLAVHVEDHPLSYIDFEGEIPAGSYGAGQVLIWDRGDYDCEKLEDGKLVVVFHGERLRGRYALFRTGRERDWMIHRMDPPSSPREPMPERLTPMLATAGQLPREEQDWAFEVKWDGVRAIAYWQPGRMRIESRNGNDVGDRYPELHALGRQLGSREAVLDGEIAAFDEAGRPSFARLQRRLNVSSPGAIRRRAGEIPVTYVLFDLLYLDGSSTLELPYRERRRLLESLRLNGSSWQTPSYREGEGRAFLRATAEHGLEGILAKRLDAPYRPGERTREWLKIKNDNRQELVIGGWLPGRGRREGTLGALLVGYPDGSGADRALRYAGRVGTGFDDAELERLTAELAARARASSPFGERGVQPPRHARFVEPELVAEIRFSRWTEDRILRHSVYLGLRPDKAASEVKLEIPPPADSQAPAVGAACPDEWHGVAKERPYELLRETRHHAEIEVAGRALRLSNRDKVLYPQAGLTKGEIIDYYAAIGPLLVPHLAGRALTLRRYPDGVEGESFYEKRCPSHRPEWVQTAAIYSEREGEMIDYCVVTDLPTLLWVANLAAIELHVSLSRAASPPIPTAMVFDLDPGPPAGLRECCRVALLLRELFDSLALLALVKTSGAKGLQVYVPLNTSVSYEQTKLFAHTVARLLEREHPELVLSRMTRDLRAGKVLIDWSQNDEHKTTVSVYSLRARERPTISTPLRWEEVGRAARARRRGELQLSAEPAELLKRVGRDGDLFAPALDLVQRLPDFTTARDRAGDGAGGRDPE
jgi:bifunctional non-homologous end joining protein LigD